MKNRFLLSTIAVLSLLLLSACGQSTPPAKMLPAEPSKPVSPAPVTGEANQKQPGLKVYQINPDGTSQQIGGFGVDMETQQTGQPAAEPVQMAAIKGILITKDGFTPDSTTMKAGSKIIFQNEDDQPHQPASDPHPTHTICPELNAPNPLNKGESFEVTITQAKVCPIHDHLNPQLKATITVTK